MTIQTTSTTLRGTNRRQRRLGVAFVGATLTVALALAAGIASWRSAGQTEHISPASVAQPAAPAVSSGSAGSASLPRTDQGGTLYVVASQAEAQVLRQALAEADNIRAAQGQPALAHRVLWFDAAEAEVRFWATQQLLGSGAASAVIDLRLSAVAASVETVYLVSTPEQAAALRARLTAEADQAGTPPNARVVVEGTDEAAIALRVVTEFVPAGLIRLVDRRMS